MKTILFLLVVLQTISPTFATAPETPSFPDLKELNKMSDRFKPTRLQVDLSKLSAGDRKALPKLVEAAKTMNTIFLKQGWKDNLKTWEDLKKDSSPLGKARLHFFWQNKGPWSEVDNHKPFIADVEARPEGANFYPEDMTKTEFETWVKSLSKEQQESARGFFSVVHRNAEGKLVLVPYSKEYGPELQKAADLLKVAANLTDNTSLKKFLELRAQAFLSDDYYASDVAWMDLDAPIEITIGPYETYNDRIFGYKAGFESFVTVRDAKETDKLGFFAGKLQEVENHLPMDPKFRNPKIGALAPIRVVNQIIATGDAGRCIPTAAYNLPNDEKVIKEKGSKRVMLKNIQEAKFKTILVPIAKMLLDTVEQKYLHFDSFFTHILAHELSHGIGPNQIKIQGRETTPRKELKEFYGALEEAKADITSLFLLQYLFDHGGNKEIQGGEENEHRLYTTYLASSFRTLRFGLAEAHGKGMALQLNYLLDKKAFEITPQGKFKVNFSLVKSAVQDLTHDLLTLEATGDYTGAKKMLEQLGVLRPEIQKALNQLNEIPTDIEPLEASLK